MRLPSLTLHCKVFYMNPNWAEENLQTIRTLMERSAVYRRALAPIMLFVGFVGVLAAIIGYEFHYDSLRAFGELWLCAALVAVTGAFAIARRQALKDREPFWSAPTRRVAQALCPPLVAGMCFGLVFLVPSVKDEFILLLVVLWLFFYGCAIHAAGFFMPSGVKILAWFFIVGASGLLIGMSPLVNVEDVMKINLNAHCLMGFFFGILHLACGAYLYLTEKRKNAA
jgi:hypothetical protein